MRPVSGFSQRQGSSTSTVIPREELKHSRAQRLLYTCNSSLPRSASVALSGNESINK